MFPACLALTHRASPLDSSDVIRLAIDCHGNSSGHSVMNRRPSVLIIFLTVFIDLIGFGIVVPLVPLYGRQFGASSLLLGIIIASYSAMQFVLSPIWGRLSDRIGRRPVLLTSTAGACLSYVLFALGSGFQNHATALVLLLIARAFA